MKTLIGDKIILRALEETDLDFLYQLENNESVWEISNTTTPYSRFILKEYLDNSHRDIYEVKQLRLVICVASENKVVGFIDLFDFEPKHKRVGLGIVIHSEEDRRKGYASEALRLVCKYAFTHLNMHQLYANISEDNKSSIDLFTSNGFKPVGIKKDWILSEGKYKDEMLFQLIHTL